MLLVLIARIGAISRLLRKLKLLNHFVINMKNTSRGEPVTPLFLIK